MILKKVPGYLYQNGTQVSPYTFYMLLDTDLVEKYKNYTSSTTLYTWSNAHITDVAKTVNDFLKFNLINKSYAFPVGRTSSELIPDFALNGIDVLGVYAPTYVLSRSDMHSSFPNTEFRMLNGCYSTSSTIGYIQYSNDDVPIATHVHAQFFNQGLGFRYASPRTGSLDVYIQREDLFTETGALCPADADGRYGLKFSLSFTFNASHTEVTQLSISVICSKSAAGNLVNYFTPAFTLADSQSQETDPDDPYQTKDDDGNDGGDGPQNDPINQPTDIPDPPNVGIGSCGLITTYIPTLAELQSLGQFLWAGAFSPDAWKKVFNDPMQALIGLAIVPAVPSAAGTKHIMFGNVDSGVSSSYITNPFVQKDFGSVKIEKDVGSFLDYTDTKISLYLPYLGFRTISPDDVMGSTLSIKYNIDCITGACAAFVKSSARGVMYAYNGSCITNIPLTGQNFSGAIQNAVTAVASGAGVIAGMASGAAPVTAMSAVSLLHSAANCALNSKPEIQRSGNLGGSAGILSVQKPFLIIQRPNYARPANMNHYVGNVTFKTLNLGSLSGFTMVEQIHLDGFTATPAELTEIDTLLKAGVIL